MYCHYKSRVLQQSWDSYISFGKNLALNCFDRWFIWNSQYWFFVVLITIIKALATVRVWLETILIKSIPCQSSASAEPCEDAFNHPTAWDNFKGFYFVGSLDNSHCPATDFLQLTSLFGTCNDLIESWMKHIVLAALDRFLWLYITLQIICLKRWITPETQTQIARKLHPQRHFHFAEEPLYMSVVRVLVPVAI